jgi:hypothetical protein
MKQPKEELDLDNDMEDIKDLNNSDHAYSSSKFFHFKFVNKWYRLLRDRKVN